MSKVVLESKNWKIEKEYLDWDIEYFSIVKKNTNESMIVTIDELEELLAFNNVPLEV